MDRAHDERSEIFLQMLHLFAVIFATQTDRTIRKFSFFCPAYKQKFYAGQCLGKPILDVPKYSMRLLCPDAYLR